jgi:hypothetical protein
MSNNRATIPEFGGTVNLGKPLLAIGTTAGTIKTTNATTYAINGLAYTKAATDNIAVTANATQAPLTTCLYVVGLDAAGAVTVVKGIEQLTADLASGNKVLQFPDGRLPTVCVIGYFKTVTASTTTFTAGTTSLAAAGVTTTYQDVFQLPPAPLLS